MHLSSSKQFISVLLFPLLTLLLGIGIGSAYKDTVVVPSQGSTSGSTLIKQNELPQEKNLGVFWDVWKRLEKEHPDSKKITEKEFIYGAIKGLASSINDPYTYFLTPTESKEFTTSLNGELEGIRRSSYCGCHITRHPCRKIWITTRGYFV